VDEIDSAVRCIEIGADDYLPKPFNPVLLRARLNASLQKKKLRDLEKAYLRQEVTLRQSEKLATLGRQIIQCCFDNGTVQDYEGLLPSAPGAS
jgi:DNA-binding response OmpR family regulator